MFGRIKPQNHKLIQQTWLAKSTIPVSSANRLQPYENPTQLPETKRVQQKLQQKKGDIPFNPKIHQPQNIAATKNARNFHFPTKMSQLVS